MKGTIRTIEHVGEWKIVARADTRAELFSLVAGAIARAIGGARGARTPWESVQVEARDVDGLLVDWANELIGRSEAAQRSYDAVRGVKLRKRPAGWIVQASIRGADVPAWRSALKAATYHGATVTRHGGRWRTELLFDV